MGDDEFVLFFRFGWQGLKISIKNLLCADVTFGNMLGGNVSEVLFKASRNTRGAFPQKFAGVLFGLWKMWANETGCFGSPL